jgi:ELWxxDGT repeat protein
MPWRGRSESSPGGRSLSERLIPRPAGEDAPFLVLDINFIGSSNPANLTPFEGEIFFAAEDGFRGRELWASDGTPNGTRFVRDVDPGEPSADLQNFAAVDGRVFFEAPTVGENGTTLWRTDGTNLGTRFLLEPLIVVIPPGATNDLTRVFATEGDLFLVESEVDFQGLSVGETLWGNPHQFLFLGEFGTFRHAFSPDPPLRHFGSMGRTLYFNGGDGGNELWRGRIAGLPPFAERVAAFSSSPRSFERLGDVLYFSAETPDAGRELWRVLGTTGPAEFVADIRPGPESSDPSGLAAVGERLFFAADDGLNGAELWVSDGTAAGSTLFADLNPGPASSAPERIAPFALEGWIFFTADDGSGGREPWRSDGTPEGTLRLGDLNPGLASSNPGNFALVAPGVVLFAAESASGGREPWRSDGTPEGTFRLGDINSGPASSDPAEFVRLGGVVMFAATAPETGRELWAIPLERLGNPAETSGWMGY